MSSVDQRVVELKFNQGAFAKGIADTLAALTRLQDGLKLQGTSQGAAEAGKGLDDLGQKTGGLGGKFSALQAVAFGALASIGSKAVSIGTQLVSSLTIDPIKSGLEEYATNMNSIQTILANTQVSGAGLPEVNAALDALNTYSDKTIYNFSEMARNIGTFTAAGVGLDQSVQSIKGIANLAALSGSNSQQASTAMYQLSQAISSGKVSLQDWNSVVNAGMGGTVFQRALASTAEKMGTLSSGSVKLTGDMQNVSIAGKSFRDSIDATNGPSWLTSDVLTKTLSQFTGDLTDAELKAQGFSAAEIASIQATAQTAQHAATEVKTLGQVFDVAKETAGSGWAQTFRLIFGDFEEAKTTFTGLSNAINGAINNAANARNDLLKGWKALGGRDVLLQGLQSAAEALLTVLRPIGEAFRSVFPAKTSLDLFRATVIFRDFVQTLIPAPKTIDEIRRTFAGLFSIVGIVFDLFKAGIHFVKDLFGSFDGAGGGILSVTANIGDFLVALRQAIKSGDVFGKIFAGLGAVIKVPIEALKTIVGWIHSLFDATAQFDGGAAWSKITDPMVEAGDRMGGIFSKVGDVLNTVRNAIGDFVGMVGGWFRQLGDVIGQMDWHWNADTILKALGITGGVGLGALLIKALNGIKSALTHFNILGSGGTGVLDSVKESLEGVTGVLKGMQQNLQANALLKIAGAIAILALSVLILAGIDAEGLVRATSALTVMFIQLGAALKVFSNIGTTGQAVKITIMGAALILLATAILILTAAVKALSTLDWNQLAKGLVGVAVLLAAITGAAKLMQGQDQVLAKTGLALLLVAVAIRILVTSVQALADMSWAEMAKGLVGVGVLLGALALFTKFAEADKGGLSQGLGILLLATALKVLASAVGDFAAYSWEELAQGMAGIGVGLGLIAFALRLIPDNTIFKAAGVAIIALSLGLIADAVGKFANLSWAEIARGMVTMAAALGVIALALNLIPPSSVLSAAAVLVVAASLGMIGDALKAMSQMSWAQLAEGLVGLAASLAIIAAAMYGMETALPGAAALIVVAAALRVLVPVIQALAALSWGELLKAMVGLAAVFLILAAAGFILAPVAVVLLAVGAALLLLGAGVALAAVGVLLFSTALTALAVSGAAGAAALGAIITTMLGLLPLAAQMLGAAIIAFAQVIKDGAPAIIGAFVAILVSLLQAVIDIAPKIGETVLALLFMLLDVIVKAVPAFIQAGITILLAFLHGIADNIGEVVDTAADIIVNFLNGIARNMGRIITAGVNLIVSFLDGIAQNIGRVIEAGFNLIVSTLEGIANGIREHLPEITSAAGDIVSALIDGIVDSVKQLAGRAIDAVKNLASDMWNGAKNFLGIGGPSRLFQETIGASIPIGISAGVDKYGQTAVDSTVSMGEDMLHTMGKTISGLGDMVGGLDDMHPVITPVLDLSSVQRGAGQIGDMLSTTPIDLNGAVAKATDASAGYAATLQALAADAASKSGVTQNFTQNNYSPKALSQAEIYRQTNNQISQAKGALTGVS